MERLKPTLLQLGTPVLQGGVWGSAPGSCVETEEEVTVLREVDMALQSVSSRGHDAVCTFSSLNPAVLQLHEDNQASAISTYPGFIAIPRYLVLSFPLSRTERSHIASFISQ